MKTQFVILLKNRMNGNVIVYPVVYHESPDIKEVSMYPDSKWDKSIKKLSHEQ